MKLHSRGSFSLYALLAVSSALGLVGCGGTSTPGATTPPVSTAVTTATALVASPNPAPAGATVTLAATVTATSGTATGNVTFYDGATSLGTVALTGGTASLPVTNFAAGSTHSLDAVYAGVAGLPGSTSAAVSLTVNPSIATAPITATALFSFSAPNQTIAGFGGAEAFFLNDLDQHPNRAAIYTALFDPAQGLGLTFLRVQNQYFAYTGSNPSTFDPDTPLIVSAANAAHGTPLTLLMSSWTPPAAIKSNNNIVGGTLGTVSGGGYNYAGFAQFWYNSLQAYAALGVTPAYISIQNEPDFTATYVSCRFNPTEAPFLGASYAGYDKALAAVYSSIQSLASPPKMIGPESFSAVNLLSYAAALETESPQSSETYALATHIYNVSSTSTAANAPDTGLAALQAIEAAYPAQLKFETEYYDQPGFNTAWNIHNALTAANDNAYFFWSLTATDTGATTALGQAPGQGELIYLDNPFAPSTWVFPSGWAYNDAYYAFKHFSYYVRPGYVRYTATVNNPNERVSVYQSTDQKTTVIVVMNTSTTATDGVSLNLANVSYTTSTVYRSTFSQSIVGGERWTNLGAYPAAGITLAPQAVATIVLNK